MYQEISKLLMYGDIDKNEISRAVVGPSNPNDIGMENVKAILEQGIHKVCSGINLREVSVFAGLAGGITGDNKEVINNFLSSFNFGAYSNGSDTDSVLEMAKEGSYEHDYDGYGYSNYF